LEQDFIATTPTGPRARGIAWTHRTAPKFDIYFISNQLDSARSINLSLRAAGRQPELWDAVTGDIRPAADWKTENGRTMLPLHLDRNGSIFVVLREATAQQSVHDGSNWLETQPVQTLASTWQVRFDTKSGGPAQPVSFPQLTDWSKNPDAAISHYSGTAIYTQSFRWQPPKQLKQQKGKLAGAPSTRVYLDLGTVANLAEVRVNGQPCGIAWTPPYRLDITQTLKKGDNQLEISVTNTWANRLIGDQALPTEQRQTWTPAPSPAAGKPLLPAGLLGPVTLEVSNSAIPTPIK
jgi:hypothetical protein